MTVSLQWWSPDGAEHSAEVDSVGDVERVAAEATEQYRGTPAVPGLELRRPGARSSGRKPRRCPLPGSYRCPKWRLP